MATSAVDPGPKWRRFERGLYDGVRVRTPGAVVPVSRVVSALSGHRVVWPLVVAASGYAYRRTGRSRVAVEPLLWLAATTAARRLIADLLRRPRPDRAFWRADASGFSCPSLGMRRLPSPGGGSRRPHCRDAGGDALVLLCSRWPCQSA